MADKKKTDEKPLKLKASSRSKAKHSHEGLSCIIHYVKHTSDKKKLDHFQMLVSRR